MFPVGNIEMPHIQNARTRVEELSLAAQDTHVPEEMAECSG
jgi:hypothetical protein